MSEPTPGLDDEHRSLDDTGQAGVLVTLRELPAAARFLLVGVLVNKLGAFMQAFLVLYLVQRGFGESSAALALGAYGAGSVLGILLGGGLNDRLGARLTIVTSMAATAALTVSVVFLPYFWAILVVVAAVGIASQAYRPAAYAMLSDIVPAGRQVMAAAAFRLALNLGTVAAPLIAAVLIKVSWSLLFWVEGAAAAGYAVIALVLLPRSPAPAAAGVAATTAEAGAPTASYLTVLRDVRYLLYLVAMLINALVYVQYLSVLPLDVRDAGLPTALYAVLISLNGAFVICCELAVTRLVQRLPARRVVTVGFVLLGTGLAMYALPGGVAVFVLATLVWSLAEVIGGPTMFAYPATVAPAHAKGRYIGAAHAMFGVGGALGPVLGVLLWREIHDGAWVVCGAVSLLAVLAANVGMRTPAPATPDTPLRPADMQVTPDEAGPPRAAAVPAASTPEPATHR